ncbi:DNA/RNA-binding protein Alba-like protein [Tanacetum coccineum]
MDRYTKVEQKKEDVPINENEIRITSQGLVRNYISYASTLLLQVKMRDGIASIPPIAVYMMKCEYALLFKLCNREKSIAHLFRPNFTITGATPVLLLNWSERRGKEIVLKAMGQAINKTVAIAEILKRNIPQLHQDTHISSISITDVWEPIEEGLLPVEMTRQVSMISITLSTKELDKSSPGYQAPLPVERPRPQYNNYQRQPPRQAQQSYNAVKEESYGENRGRSQVGGRGVRGRGWNRGGGYGNQGGGGYGNQGGGRYGNQGGGGYGNQGGGGYGNQGGGGYGNQGGGRYGNQGGGYGNYEGDGYRNYQGGGGYSNYQGGRGYGNSRGGRGYGNYQDRGDYGNYQGGGEYGNYQDNNGYSNRGRSGGRGGNAGYRAGGGYMRGGNINSRGGGNGGAGGRYNGRGRGRMGGRPRDGGDSQQQ